MEDLIKRFMYIEPIGSGDGYGDGSGDGSGYGDGDGSGDGDGDGSGYGDGSGDGYGYGDGSGYGYGDIKESHAEDYRKGYLSKEIHSFKTFDGHNVYYIDDIPCYFLAIVGNMAKVMVINNDMSVKQMYIAKSGNLFAHGDTKEYALCGVSEKFYSSLSFEQKKSEFIKTFIKNGSYSNRLFFQWHHFLTGSCESGRTMFIKSHGISLDGSMTTLEFLNATKSEYNGHVIREILEAM